MAAETFTFNIAKGRVVEFFNRVDKNEPSGSVIVVVPMKELNTKSEGQDSDTLAAVEALGSFAEQKEGWERVVLTDANIASIAVDDANDRFPATLPEVEFNEPTSGKNLQGFLICYDPKAGEGEDSEIIPLTAHAKTVTADGNDVIIKEGEVFRAS